MPATTTETERQPLRPTSEAKIGRNTSCPVAVLAVRTPMTRPRWAVNQRWTIVAPRTIAVAPVPSPTSTPQKSTSCHGVRIAVVRATPVATSARDAMTVRRMPTDCMNAAANGPTRP